MSEPTPDEHERRPRRPMARRSDEIVLWKQALTGIGLVTLGALLAVGVGLVMAAVLSWLF